MNWKNNFKKKLIFISCFFLIVLLSFLLIEYRIDYKINNKILGITAEDKLTEIYSETSPDGINQIILYKRPFTGRSDHEYKNYLNNQHLFVVREFEPWVEHDLFVGDNRVGYPHWLGNDFIFFTAGCGTGCRGLYLVDTRSKESYLGTITTTPVSKDGFETYFHDWFDHEFEFVGFDKNIRSVYLNDKVYLIFEMWNNNQAIGEKKFLFTGDSLKEE